MRRMKRQPTHPGYILKLDYLEPLAISVTEMASNLNVSRKTLSKIIVTIQRIFKDLLQIILETPEACRQTAGLKHDLL